jgi:hypothetical protein
MSYVVIQMSFTAIFLRHAMLKHALLHPISPKKLKKIIENLARIV